MPVAANIDEVIAFCATDIAHAAYGGAAPSLFMRMGQWNAGMFSNPSDVNGGIFPPQRNEQSTNAEDGQRRVTDWLAESLMARAAIEGPGISDPQVVGTSACINAVTRVANAVKYAALATAITGAQQSAVVTLYNTVWT